MFVLSLRVIAFAVCASLDFCWLRGLYLPLPRNAWALVVAIYFTSQSFRTFCT